MFHLFVQASGLTRLIERYPAAQRPEGVEREKQTVKIGAVRYRRCVTINVSSHGLYLWVRPPLSKHPPVLIPWDSVRRICRTRLYGRKAVRLLIVGPQVTPLVVHEGLFKSIRPHLSRHLVEPFEWQPAG
jgi:hypothetical protein